MRIVFVAARLFAKSSPLAIVDNRMLLAVRGVCKFLLTAGVGAPERSLAGV